MTGSGKTGLGIVLLEELAKQKIPAIILDPKGDLTNLMLHDKGKFDIDFTIYTPGSREGRPVSILASLQAPRGLNDEAISERINSTVTAILGLAGYSNVNPVKSREHILLSNIFQHAWVRGEDLDMPKIIGYIQAPPFTKLGIFSLEQFYPEAKRYDLAMGLNSLLAAPSFQSWLVGEPFDIANLLDNKHAIFYLAHLNDQERMFFVTLLYTAVESWMRTLPGVEALRAVVYFDEIAGYLPPVSNPPSKNIILRMLKQARAFGVGLVLATQNPIDLDYKALSNAGTWFVGKLQTEQDKKRLMEGLQRDFDISGLGKREFLLHTVYTDPVIFKTRNAINRLEGPIERAKIADLNLSFGHEPLELITMVESEAIPVAPVDTYYLRGKSHYSPSIHGQAVVSYKGYKRRVAINLTEIDSLVEFETAKPYDKDDLTTQAPQATYANLDLPLHDLKQLEKDFVDWIYRTKPIPVKEYNGIIGYPNDNDFEKRCLDHAQGKSRVESDKVKQTYDNKIDSVLEKIRLEEQRLEIAEKDHQTRKAGEWVSDIEVAMSIFQGRMRSFNTPMSKRRMTERAKAKIDTHKHKLNLLNEQLVNLKEERNERVYSIKDKWQRSLKQIEYKDVYPYKKDIHVELFGLLWK